MSVSFEFKDRYDVNDLISIVALLRAPGGCPWDAEQTHESIKKNFIEETYEVIEAINKNDKELLLEELGDVLLQVVFHAQMETEISSFGFSDVADGICKKLIERHPHVFGDVVANGTDEVLTNWEAIKRKTKGQKSRTDSMLSVPRELPALMRAYKVQKKAADAGFDWDDVSGARAKLTEELAELDSAAAAGNDEEIKNELGDVLFSAVNTARFLHCDPEEALTASTNKFISRFSAVEKAACERGLDMKTASLAELDAIWDEVKKAESTKY